MMADLVKVPQNEVRDIAEQICVGWESCIRSPLHTGTSNLRYFIPPR